MIPFGNETVTLVHRVQEQIDNKTQVNYERHLLTGCSWQRIHRYNREGDVLVPAEGVTCRVPVGQTRPNPGDLLILGNVAVVVNTGADFQSLIEHHRNNGGAFVVASISDNARPGMPMPHYAARGA